MAAEIEVVRRLKPFTLAQLKTLPCSSVGGGDTAICVCPGCHDTEKTPLPCEEE